MFPSAIAPNVFDEALAYPKDAGHLFTRSGRMADEPNNGIGQNAFNFVLAHQHPASIDGVLNVLCMGAPAEMCRVAARRVVAGVEAVRRCVRSIGSRKLQSDHVCAQMVLFPINVHRPLSVSINAFRHFPRPATVRASRFINAVPEFCHLLIRGGFSNIKSHMCGSLAYVVRVGMRSKTYRPGTYPSLGGFGQPSIVWIR